MFNATQISNLTSNSVSTTYNYSTSALTGRLTPNQTQQLGYGLGRLARMAFDQIANAWQSWWNKPSAEQMAMRRRIGIFRQSVRELVPNLLGPIIGAVVGGVVVIAGVTVTILFLRFKKKGCFADDNGVPTKGNNDDGIFEDV